MHHVSDALARIAADPNVAPAFRAAISTGLEQANDNLAAALSERFYRKPFFIAEVLTGVPVWPCGYTLAELAVICRDKRREQRDASTHEAIALRACDKALTRIIAEAARLHIEGRDTAA